MVGFDEVVSVFDILMVEDEKELAKLLKIYIERANYTIQLVTSGEEALDFLKNNTVKMLLLDITLLTLMVLLCAEKYAEWAVYQF